MLNCYEYIFRFQFVESNNLDLFIWTNMLTISNLRSEQMEVYFSFFLGGGRDTARRKLFAGKFSVVHWM